MELMYVCGRSVASSYVVPPHVNYVLNGSKLLQTEMEQAQETGGRRRDRRGVSATWFAYWEETGMRRLVRSVSIQG